MPRSKKIWVFIGWHRGGPDGEIFADNTKYLFLHVSTHHPQIQTIWLAKSERFAAKLRSNGYRSYYEKSWAGRWYALRAYYTIIDAFLQRYNFRYSGRSKIVQLLHGKGMKKKGYSEPQYRKQDIIFAPSQFVIDLLPDSFKAGSDIIITGYPRTDILHHAIDNAQISSPSGLEEKISRIKGANPKANLIWYAPTFRRGHKNLEIEEVLKPRALNEWLLKNNRYLIISLHPKYREQGRNFSFSNIYFAEDGDYYPLMSNFSLLVTDYSSIFTDFLLLNRPIIFYAYDRSEYETNEGIAIDYDHNTPGPKVYNYDDLLSAIDQELVNDTRKPDRDRSRTLYHEHFDGKSSARISQHLLQLIGQPDH